MVAVGLTLPNFVRDPGIPLDIARAADATETIALVVGYDHLFRVARDGTRRPALECFALLGAVAAATERVRVGTLVVRAALRPSAVTAANFATLDRIAPGRIVAGIGAGDGESRAENEEFGIGFGTVDERLATLDVTVESVVATGVETWVGGSAHLVGPHARRAGVWNRWGGTPESLADEALRLHSEAPTLRCTWGGLVVLAPTDDAARAKADRLGVSTTASSGVLVGAPATVATTLRRYADAGADTVVLGPVDSSSLDNVELVAEIARMLA